MKQLFLPIIVLCFISCQIQQGDILPKSDFKHYIEKFNVQDTLNLHVDVVPGSEMKIPGLSWRRISHFLNARIRRLRKYITTDGGLSESILRQRLMDM